MPAAAVNVGTTGGISSFGGDQVVGWEPNSRVEAVFGVS